MVVGDPADDKTEMGSLVSQKQRERVLDYVAVGTRGGRGARAWRRGPDAAACSTRGAYLSPTVFDALPDGHAHRARGDLRSGRARSSPSTTRRRRCAWPTTRRTASRARSGAATSARALRVAKGVQAGVLSVNSNSSVHTEAPFGGYKMSGIGRELGMHGLELYTEVKNVFVDLS